MKEVYMHAIFEVIPPKNIDLKKNPTNITVGGFEVKTLDGTIPFDFDAGGCESIRRLPGNENKYLVNYQSGEGPFFNAPDITDCFDAEYHAIGLTRNSITASYLASAKEITEFFVMCWDADDQEIIPKVRLIDISFYDENEHKYSMTDSVIEAYNQKGDSNE